MGKREGRGLAGAGLGATHHVVPFEHEWDGLLLDRRRRGVVAVAQGALDGLAESEGFESDRHWFG